MSTAAYIIQGDATRVPLADASVDMVFTSPPYMDARTYGINAHRSCQDWIEWMLEVVTELTRVCSGLVLVNCAGVTRDRVYWPGCEGLMYEWWKRGGNLWRPAYWHRVGIPGSGGKQWLRADIEYVIPFKRDAEWLPWSDNTANGRVPKSPPGGAMSYRMSDGTRVGDANRDAWGFGGRRVRTRSGTKAFHLGNDESETGGTPAVKPMYRRNRTGERQNEKMMNMIAEHGAEPKVAHLLANGFPPGGKLHTKSTADGMRVQAYLPPALANPGNIVKVIVGGGVMGSKLAHENEAPFPEALAEWFIKSWCPVGGKVLDPFSGSGTTASVARRLGRVGIGMDLRWSQCELGARRLNEPEKTAKVKRAKVVSVNPEPDLFSAA